MGSPWPPKLPDLSKRRVSLTFLRSPSGPFDTHVPHTPSCPPSHAPRLAWWVRGSPSAGGLWLGGISWDRGCGPPQMGLHVAGQLGRGLAVHAAQLAQDAVSPRGLEPMVLHRVDAQVCCCGEAYGGGDWIGIGEWGQPGGDPRDGAVLLGWGHPPQMTLSSSHVL